jgi:hypothetical protein
MKQIKAKKWVVFFCDVKLKWWWWSSIIWFSQIWLHTRYEIENKYKILLYSWSYRKNLAKSEPFFAMENPLHKPITVFLFFFTVAFPNTFWVHVMHGSGKLGVLGGMEHATWHVMWPLVHATTCMLCAHNMEGYGCKTWQGEKKWGKGQIGGKQLLRYGGHEKPIKYEGRGTKKCRVKAQSGGMPKIRCLG